LGLLQGRSAKICVAFFPLKKALFCDWLFAILTNIGRSISDPPLFLALPDSGIADRRLLQ
jgi:hypothetical protein